MTGGKKPQGHNGYTIVEVLIFLAITSALFVMIAVPFTRQQGRAGFVTAARDMESRMQDIINDISTGFYTRPSNFQCTASLAGPVVSGGGSGQGTNEGCIFIGRVAHFMGAGTGRYNVYSVIGLRETQTGLRRDVQNFAEAQPRAIPALTDSQTVSGGLTFHSMYYQASSGGPRQRVDAIGFFSSFGTYSNGSLKSGPLRINVIPIVGSGSPSGSNQAQMTSTINALTDAYVLSYGNPEGRTVICMNSNTSDQHAELSIGGNDRELGTNMVINQGGCPAV